MRTVKEYDKGVIILELSIVLPVFLFVILGIYGLFVISIAENQIMHAMIQATNSLCMDSYLTEQVDSAAEEGTIFWSDFPDELIDIIRIGNDRHFSSSSDWYDKGLGAEHIAKARFIGYLAGGDEVKADEKLKAMGVVDGLSGIIFVVKGEGEDITLIANYELQLWFDFFDVGKIPIKQGYKGRLWK